jgi:hypothetical protein
MKLNPFRRLGLVLCGALLASTSQAAAPEHVDITWMSIANMHFSMGEAQVVADAYFTRLPQALFHGGVTDLAYTHSAQAPDTDQVRAVFEAIGGKSAVKLLLTGHSHFDHSFDVATLAKLADAPVIGSMSTCLQTRAEQLPANRCTPVAGGERFELAPGIAMYVIRWNHSGSPTKNPEQHSPVELAKVPVPEANGGMRAGLTEDFPNGGGSRAYLFALDGPKGRYSFFFHDTAAPAELHVPIVVNGVNYGAPLENLRAAMKQAHLDRVDLWIGTGGRDSAQLIVPIIRPRAHLPVHWDGLWGKFRAGVPAKYQDEPAEKYLAAEGVTLLVPQQYMDKWRLGRDGVRAVPNIAVQQALGFAPASPQ